MNKTSRVIAALLFAASTSAATAATNIVDTAASAGKFNTLMKAVTAAGLADTLRGEGPFTVFAPTDEAFAKLPEGKLDALLQDKEQLARVLSYHVVPGKVTKADVSSGEVATVQGQALRIQAEGGAVKVNDASVMQPDIMASNGVIHVIDRVVLPN